MVIQDPRRASSGSIGQVRLRLGAEPIRGLCNIDLGRCVVFGIYSRSIRDRCRRESGSVPGRFGVDAETIRDWSRFDPSSFDTDDGLLIQGRFGVDTLSKCLGFDMLLPLTCWPSGQPGLEGADTVVLAIALPKWCRAAGMHQ